MTILTILGAGNYAETNYVWGEHACRTNLFPAAVSSWFREATVKVVATGKAWETHGTRLADAIPSAERIPIPDGASDAELWEIFNKIVDAIPEGEEVVFDITHGFRSQPVIALLVAAFLRVAKGIQLKHIVYGAYEKDKENSPVFDLTPFVAMLDWASATERFLETGDARKFHDLLGDSLPPLADTLYGLSEGVAFLRTVEVARRAGELPEAIRSAKEAMGPEHAPLGLLLERIEESFKPLADREQQGGVESLKAQWQQIKWLVDNGHYPAAASLAREWLVSVQVAYSQNRPILPVDNRARSQAEGWLNTADRKDLRDSPKPEGHSKYHEAPEDWKPVVKLWAGLGEMRNDLMHCGMRKAPMQTDLITKKVKALPGQLADAVKPVGLEVGP